MGLQRVPFFFKNNKLLFLLHNFYRPQLQVVLPTAVLQIISSPLPEKTHRRFNHHMM